MKVWLFLVLAVVGVGIANAGGGGGNGNNNPHQSRNCRDCCFDDDAVVDVDLIHYGIGGPTSIQFGRLPGDKSYWGNRMFIATQDGRVFYSAQGGGGALTLLLDVSSFLTPLSAFYDEEGLLGLALHPYFYTNGRFFVYYTTPAINATSAPPCFFAGGLGGQPGTRQGLPHRPYNATEYASAVVLEEYSAGPEGSEPSTFVNRWLTMKHPFTNHNGIDNLMFDSENNDLLIAVGDGGCYLDQFGFAQNRSHLLGKVLVVDVNSVSRVAENCTTEVGTFEELGAACPNTRILTNLYAMGVRNAGHMSLDKHNGIVNRYIAFIGQNRKEAIYRFEFESNFGWVTLEGNECTCLLNDPLRVTNCDFEQTVDECRSASTAIGYVGYTLPLVTANQVTSRTRSIVGGHVYRSNALGCIFEDAYIFGDWSQGDNGIPGFPAPFTGEPTLWIVRPDDNGHNNGDRELSKGRVRIRRGLVTNKNYLYSIGYDAESGDFYLGVNGQISPVQPGGAPSIVGRIYKLKDAKGYHF